MASGEDFLFRPVVAHMITAEKLIDPASGVDLELISTMNEALDVQAENERRIHERQ